MVNCRLPSNCSKWTSNECQNKQRSLGVENWTY